MDLTIVAGDSGRSGTKIVSSKGKEYIPSIIGEYRTLKSEKSLDENKDFILEYDHTSWFIGNLAAVESEFPIQDSRETKNHIATKLLGILAMYRSVNDGDECLYISSEPIDDHNDENKATLKRMWIGKQTAILNGVKKTWNVVRSEVAAEGAVSIWGLKDVPEILHIIDLGSRKINYAVTVNKSLYDKLSGSLNMGTETVRHIQPALFVHSVISQISRRWLKQLGNVMLIGGLAEQLAPEFEKYFQGVFVHPEPLYANAIGMYELGKKLAERSPKNNAQIFVDQR